MGREIKYRGKRIDNGEWVRFNFYGAYVDENGSEISPRRFTRDYGFKVVSETVGEYTGLKDKNGREIFEGDIVGDLEWTHPLVVSIENGHTVIKFKDLGLSYTELLTQGEINNEEFKVCGNIYENPELLEGKIDG